MRILGKEFELDFFDADVQSKIESGMEKIKRRVEENKEIKEQKSSDVIKKTCEIIYEFFDCILGVGASNAIFGEKKSLRLTIEAYDEFVEEKIKQEKVLEELTHKYSANRVTRRSKK